jgi:hypothetical protein
MINRFTDSPERFLLKESYEPIKSIYFLVAVVLATLILTLVKAVLITRLTSEVFSLPIIILAKLGFWIFIAILYVIVMNQFVGKKGIKMTFLAFSYCQIPLLLILPCIYAYQVFSAWWAGSAAVIATHLTLIGWMYIFFLFISLRSYVKGLSILHRVPFAKVAVWTTSLTLIAAGSLLLSPISFWWLL